ncbi:hypothetical protein SUGI_1163470 [Cryptomeria japonica]|nr:hypothetical protein SUGI_1163470 [Cryptomeria japonica]
MEEAKKPKTGIKGSRPAPLKVSKDSHNCTKIKPVIIYLRSPEVIHTQPKDFKALVQRLTGRSSSSSFCTQLREDFSTIQTNPKSFCPVENRDIVLHQATPPPPVYGNDYLSQIIYPPWNSLGELDLDFDMLWDP